MKLLTKLLAGVALLLPGPAATAQTPRIRDRNIHAWYDYSGTLQLHQNWTLYTELSLRRADLRFPQLLGGGPQQMLLRSALLYRLSKDLQGGGGYVYSKTFAYGDYPGGITHENRLFEQVQYIIPIRRLQLTQRGRLEQRWSRGATGGTNYTNRARFKLQLEVPLFKAQLGDPGPYAVLYDEAFLSFGRRVVLNVFDQNRLGAGLGFAFSRQAKLEVNYLNQILAHGDLVAERTTGRLGQVYEFNHTLLVGLRLQLRAKPANQATPEPAPTPR